GLVRLTHEFIRDLHHRRRGLDELLAQRLGDVRQPRAQARRINERAFARLDVEVHASVVTFLSVTAFCSASRASIALFKLVSSLFIVSCTCINKSKRSFRSADVVVRRGSSFTVNGCLSVVPR